MIDVVFQLVVFFLMSSTFVVAPGIEMNLPGSSTTQSVSTEAISVYLYQDGRVFLNGDQIALEALSERLLNSDWPREAPVSLLAEDRTDYQLVIGVLDELRKSGFVRVSLRAEARP